MEFIFIILSWMILLVPGFDDSVPPTGDKIFKIETSPDIVQSIAIESDESFDFAGFDIKLKQNSTGVLEIKIPKNLPHPASYIGFWAYDERPIVLTDGFEIGYDIVEDPCYSHYRIPIEDKTNLEILYTVILTGSWQLYSPIEFDKDNPCYSNVFYEKPRESPLKQLKSGITIDQIQCREGFAVAIKKSNGNPNCVKRETLEKLRERGWAEPLGDIVFQKPSQSKSESDDTLSESDYDPHSPRCGSGVIPYIPENWQTTGMHPSDETWEALGNYLMKQEFYKELQSRNIVFEPACFGVYTGMVEQSYPPRFSMCSMVTASNGTDIYLEGTVNEFDVIYFDIDNKIPYQCDDDHHGCLCELEK